ncbi:hypothetical protein [Novosphingobium nitrogenifigens]|nr:hypothetical protein [Novosphingobium nitrogenifigens]
MGRERKKPISAAKRLALPIWVFGMMQMAGVQTTAGLVGVIEGPWHDNRRTDPRESQRTLIDQYSRAEKYPSNAELSSSFISRIESNLPGSRRYLLSRMWALMDGEEVPTEDLLASLKTCPALDDCEAIVAVGDGSQAIADFGATIQPRLERDRSLWRLEALVLLAAYAQQIGDEGSGRKIASYYQAVEADIVLPPFAEHCRRELSALSFSFIFRSWLKPDDVSTHGLAGTKPSPVLWRGGKYPVWATGTLCLIMLVRFAYAPDYPLENPILFAGAAALVAAVTAFPQLGRLTGCRMALQQGGLHKV